MGSFDLPSYPLENKKLTGRSIRLISDCNGGTKVSQEEGIFVCRRFVLNVIANRCVTANTKFHFQSLLVETL